MNGNGIQTYDADVIDLDEIGMTANRNDKEIVRYIKRFVKENFGHEINDDTAMVINFIVSDFYSDMEQEQKYE